MTESDIFGIDYPDSEKRFEVMYNYLHIRRRENEISPIIHSSLHIHFSSLHSRFGRLKVS
jgi:NADH:ubiquinone oxidoreductase subunit C